MRQTLRNTPFRGDLAEFIIPEHADPTVNSAGSASQKALCRVLPGYGRLPARNSAVNGLSGGSCRVYPYTGNPPNELLEIEQTNELLEFERANGVRRGQPETTAPKQSPPIPFLIYTKKNRRLGAGFWCISRDICFATTDEVLSHSPE